MDKKCDIIKTKTQIKGEIIEIAEQFGDFNIIGNLSKYGAENIRYFFAEVSINSQLSKFNLFESALTV